MGAAEVARYVRLGDGGEVGAALVGDQPALLADGAQQPAGQCPGAGSGLEHAGAGKDVGEADDLRRVLRVDDRGATGHRQRVVGQQRAQRDVEGAARGTDDAALVHADEVVMRDRPAMGVEGPSGGENKAVPAALLVGQLYLVPRLERPSPPDDHAAQASAGLAQLMRHTPAKARSRSAVARTPNTFPDGSISRYSLDGARCTALIRSMPDRSADSTISGLSVLASEPTSIHGLRSSGVACTAASLTTAVGVSSWSTITKALAPASWARLTASASGRLAETGMACLASVRALTAGSRSRILAALIA